MDILALAQSKTQLHKTSSTHGGEFVGPCPSCGGHDRFHVWPDKIDSKRSERVGIYWCRGCGKAGDIIQWFVEFEGMSYADAFRAIGEQMPDGYRHTYAAPQLRGAKTACTSKIETPNQTAAREQPEEWLKRAIALVEHAEQKLPENSYILGWLKKRGISKKTAAGMRLGWLVEDNWRPRARWGLPPEEKDDGRDKKLWIPAGLVIPLLQSSGPCAAPSVRRIRIRRFNDREPRFYVLPGSLMSCMTHGLPNRAVVVVESELDAIMIAGIAPDLAAVVAMGTAKAKPGPELLKAISACSVVLVALDFGDADLAGAKGWSWWKESFPQAKRWPVPVGKDPGEAFAAGIDMREWIKAGLPRGWFLGPSPIGLVSGKKAECDLYSGGAKMDAPAGNPPAPSADAGSLRGPIAELAGLLRKHPVEIRVAADGSRIWIRENQNWKAKNWEVSKRISELVYQDCEVLEYLVHHGAEIINGKNILKGE